MDANTSDLLDPDDSLALSSTHDSIATDDLVEFSEETSFSAESASYVESPSIPTDNLEFEIGSSPFVPSIGKTSTPKSLSYLCTSSSPNTSVDVDDYDDLGCCQWIAQVARTRKTKVCYIALRFKCSTLKTYFRL